MEIRASTPNAHAPYVNTGIPKVAETPLEGCEASTQETFGPFPTDSATMPKSPNSKGHSVRFEGASEEEFKPDPIEKAIDSIFLFIDDVREAGNTVRGEGCMSIVTDGLCRNPCADPCTESFRQIQPPVDLMLDTQSPTPSTAGDEQREGAEPVASPRAQQMDFEMMSKENSVKDLSASVAEEKKKMEEEKKAEEEAGPVPTYTPVETISDKVRTWVPENTLQLVMDSFEIKTGEVKANAEELTVKTGEDIDPIVEAIDRLILFFDDVQEALMGQKKEHLARTMTSDLQASLMEKRDSLTNIDATAETDYDKSSDTTLSEDTMKAANPSLQMAPQDYADAVASAAEILAQTAPPEAQLNLTKEELHKQALERIMAEIPDFEEGATDNKTEAQILEELMKDAENAIRVSRSKERNAKEELVVLGHSGTLTPIPEADEASAGTPASDLIEQAVIKGTIPQVPLLPVIADEKEEAKEVKEQLPVETPKAPEVKEVKEQQLVETPKARETPVAQKEEPVKQVEPIKKEVTVVAAPVEKVQAASGALVSQQAPESDPIVAFIDRIFMFFDDVQEQRPCEGCLGASTPNEIADGDDIVEAEEPKENESSILRARLSELKKPIDSRGQKMLEEALRLVQEAQDADDALVAIRSTDVEDRTKLSPAATELIEKLGAAFDEVRDQMEPQSEKKIVARGIKMEDNEKNRAIAKLVEAAFEESDKLRRALNSAVDHPGLKNKGMGSPQMSADMSNLSNERQAKVEFEIPELMKHSQDPYVAWEGDDSELMASINADRKLSEMEHENIFRDVSKGLQESAGGIITRADNPIFSIYNAPAFTEGNSGSAELPEDKLGDPARAAVKALCGESAGPAEVKAQPDIVASRSSDALRARELGPAFPGWGMSTIRQDKLRSKNSM